MPEALLAVASTLVGACVGSFVATLARRAPEDWQGALLGRSACPRCGTPLGAVDLVPLLSWLALRGRCRRCGAPIARYYPLVEAAAALVGLAAALLHAPLLAVLGWWLLALALIDLRTGLLPDALTVPLVGLGFVIHRPLTDALIGAAAGYAALWLVRWLYARLRGREGLGLGDAKLMAAAGAWLGWQALPWVLTLGAALTLVAALLQRRELRAETSLPLGPGLAGAMWLVYLSDLSFRLAAV